MSAASALGIGSTDPHAGAVLHSEPEAGPRWGALVLVHGRGADAGGMMELGRAFSRQGLYLVAPQAVGFTWYPYSFLAPFEQNEPFLSSALSMLDRITSDVVRSGVPHQRIALLGFSQGACLTLEFAARNPRRYGAVIGFSGGLIGPPGTSWSLEGSMDGTPVFLGCSDRDPHIPLSRFEETTHVFNRLGALVDQRVYPGMGHTIVADEMRAAEALIAGMLPASHGNPPSSGDNTDDSV